jgi:hypothetical protein
MGEKLKKQGEKTDKNVVFVIPTKSASTNAPTVEILTVWTVILISKNAHFVGLI